MSRSVEPRDLRSLQYAFQRSLLAGDVSTLASLDVAPADALRHRASVYADGYVGRLCEVLALDFPCTWRELGEAPFLDVARAYIASHPSRYRSARHVGASFPAYLRGVVAIPARVAELAAFEWTLGEAFDARDAAPITRERLAALPLSAWPALGITFHPSLRLFTAAWNVARRQRALAGNETPPAWRRRTGTWLVWRAGLEVRQRRLETGERTVLERLVSGACWHDACAAAAGAITPARIARFLAGWLAAGLVIGLRPPPGPPRFAGAATTVGGDVEQLPIESVT